MNAWIPIIADCKWKTNGVTHPLLLTNVRCAIQRVQLAMIELCTMVTIRRVASHAVRVVTFLTRSLLGDTSVPYAIVTLTVLQMNFASFLLTTQRHADVNHATLRVPRVQKGLLNADHVSPAGITSIVGPGMTRAKFVRKTLTAQQARNARVFSDRIGGVVLRDGESRDTTPLIGCQRIHKLLMPKMCYYYKKLCMTMI